MSRCIVDSEGMLWCMDCVLERDHQSDKYRDIELIWDIEILDGQTVDVEQLDQVRCVKCQEALS